MEKLKDLRALLIHEIQDVYSAEEQIIAGLPRMIEKASNTKLRKALKEHLQVTRTQKSRLDKVQQLMKLGEEDKGKGRKSGLFGLFGVGQVCKGMQGLIQEGEKIMKEDINEEVLDAAIIASCQKIEHYEICAYGTMKAYARELGLTQVEKLFDQTLEEEYEADEMLTMLAVDGGLNQKAEKSEAEARSRSTSSAAESRGSSRERSASPPTSGARKSTSTSRTGAARSNGAAGKSGASKSKTGTTTRKASTSKR